ncbi:MAG: hypothetical protein NTZ05_12280 [Chloroflexi bacterium]|nr:hypothetical protein [Chloroflexota bacterium]
MAGKRKPLPGDAEAEAPPDDANHQDTGCEKLMGPEYRSCLACPLVVCVEDLTVHTDDEAVARRRQRAASLAGRGRTRAQIARSLGVSQTSVRRYLKANAPAAGQVRSSHIG